MICVSDISVINIPAKGVDTRDIIIMLLLSKLSILCTECRNEVESVVSKSEGE